MKQFLLLLLTISMLACGGGSDPAPTPTPPTPTVSVSTLVKKVWTVSTAQWDGVTKYDKTSSSNVVQGYSQYKLDLSTAGSVTLTEFDGKSFQDAARGELDLSQIIGESDKSEVDAGAAENTQHGDKITRIKTLLGDQVQDVRSTSRLTDSPACLVVGDNDMGEQMRKIMEAAGQAVPESKPILEVNMAHPLVTKLGDESEDAAATVLAKILFDQAALSAGRPLENPAEFVQQLNRLMFN